VFYAGYYGFAGANTEIENRALQVAGYKSKLILYQLFTNYFYVKTT
jgi:hypothetical protein